MRAALAELRDEMRGRGALLRPPQLSEVECVGAPPGRAVCGRPGTPRDAPPELPGSPPEEDGGAEVGGAPRGSAACESYMEDGA